MLVAPSAELGPDLGRVPGVVGLGSMLIPVDRIEAHLNAMHVPAKERGKRRVVLGLSGELLVGSHVLECARWNVMVEVALGYISDQLAKSAGVQRASIAVKEKSPRILSLDQLGPVFKKPDQTWNKFIDKRSFNRFTIRNLLSGETKHPHIVGEQIWILRPPERLGNKFGIFRRLKQI